MDPLAIILCLLGLTCTTVSVVLWVAWLSFGRARHAGIWGLGSALAALGWWLGLAGHIWMPASLWPEPTTSALMIASDALLLIGFRRRAALPSRAAWIGVTGSLLLVPVVVGMISADSALLVDVPPFIFAGICLSGSVGTLLGRRMTAADRAAAVVMGLFACFYAASAIIAITIVPLHAAHSGVAFQSFLMLGLPAGFVGTGFSCILLLAADLAERMRALAATDPLTGALNRRGLNHAAAPTIANCRRRGEPITLVVADLDRFKAINDRLGHATGDIVLQRFAAYVTREVRGGDLFARLGGEEFAILLPGTACASAAEVIDRVRRGVPALCIEAIAPLSLTASFGIAAIGPGESNLAAALARADRALYASKLAGRDRVTVLDDDVIATAAAA